MSMKCSLVVDWFLNFLKILRKEDRTGKIYFFNCISKKKLVLTYFSFNIITAWIKLSESHCFFSVHNKNFLTSRLLLTVTNSSHLEPLELWVFFMQDLETLNSVLKPLPSKQECTGTVSHITHDNLQLMQHLVNASPFLNDVFLFIMPVLSNNENKRAQGAQITNQACFIA